MIKQRRNYQEETLDETNIWTSFTDLMSNAFMILSLILFITLMRIVLVTQENEQLKQELELQNTPPVLIIQDSGEFKFPSGSAVLPSALETYIQEQLVAKIEEITAGSQAYTVEIVGHTDGQVLGGGNSNLDDNLENVARGNSAMETLQPGSNADLGLMRSLAVVKELQNIQAQGRLEDLQFRAYSAAQLFLPNSDQFAAVDREENPTRRRIEIRFSPLGEAEIIR